MAQFGMKPVALWEGDAVKRIVTDVESAALFLRHHWPPVYRGSVAHLTAQMAALSALKGHKSVDHFRAALVQAADAAGVLAQDVPGSDATMAGHVAPSWARRRKRATWP